MIGKRARWKTCEAIKGILKEGHEIMEEYAGSEALDAGLLAGGQAVEHYEMSRYGALKAWATRLGMKDAAALLDQTLRERRRRFPSQQVGAGEGQSESRVSSVDERAERRGRRQRRPRGTVLREDAAT